MKRLNLNKIFCCVGSGNRDASLRRYLLKFESFSILSANGNKKYESSVFQSNGYKWKMIIYPNGDGSVEGRDHISVYLAIAETRSLQSWEVNATFSFFIFDQISGRYLLMGGMEQRFDNLKAEWGYSKCISHETFREPSNGYLVNDKCVFGVDLYVIKNHGLGECMSLVNVFKSYIFHWKISNFHGLGKFLNVGYSGNFAVGGYKWRLRLYPRGNPRQNGQSFGIYLELVDAMQCNFRKRIQTKFSISVKDKTGPDHCMTTASSGVWFAAPNHLCWGWSSFMPLSKLKDPKKSFIVGDCFLVGLDVTILRVVNALT